MIEISDLMVPVLLEKQGLLEADNLVSEVIIVVVVIVATDVVDLGAAPFNQLLLKGFDPVIEILEITALLVYH